MAASSTYSPSLLMQLRKVIDWLLLPLSWLSIVIVVLALYQSALLGPFKDDLWPAAIGILIAFFIQSLQRIEEALAGKAAKSFPKASDAAEELAERVSHDTKLTDIRILAATGNITLLELLPKICKASHARSIRITMNVFDTDGPFGDRAPEDWPGALASTLTKAMKEYADSRYELTISACPYLPAVHAILINGEHLLIGFFAWEWLSSTERLTGSERQHWLYRRSDPAAAPFFELFDTWFDREPQRLLVPKPSPPAAPAPGHPAS